MLTKKYKDKNKYQHLNLPSGTIRLSVTNRCNMNCWYCHNEGQDSAIKKDLSYDKFVKLIDIAREFGLRGISFTGGEPFLNRTLKRMIQYCEKIKLDKIDICTNGILIRDKIDLLKISPKIDLTIGIDTCYYNKISKQSNKGETFEYIEENLDLLKKNKIKFSINSVFTGANTEDIIAMARYCIKKRIDLRIIELDTKKMLTTREITSQFNKLITKISKRFGLKIGYIYPGKGFFGIAKNGIEISFYDAYCHNRDCKNCARWTLRIDTLGEAIPCYAKDLRISLLARSPKKSYEQFLKAIYNMGIPPEDKPISFK